MCLKARNGAGDIGRCLPVLNSVNSSTLRLVVGEAAGSRGVVGGRILAGGFRRKKRRVSVWDGDGEGDGDPL